MKQIIMECTLNYIVLSGSISKEEAEELINKNEICTTQTGINYMILTNNDQDNGTN